MKRPKMVFTIYDFRLIKTIVSALLLYFNMHFYSFASLNISSNVVVEGIMAKKKPPLKEAVYRKRIEMLPIEKLFFCHFFFHDGIKNQ